MRKVLASFCLMGFLGGCMQTENSNSSDAFITDESDPRSILQQNCASCHDYHKRSDENLVASGLVVAGNPEGSQIYFRLIGSQGAQGPKNMPLSGALSPSSVQRIYEWIQDLN